jgi:hypothetical protein
MMGIIIMMMMTTMMRAAVVAIVVVIVVVSLFYSFFSSPCLLSLSSPSPFSPLPYYPPSSLSLISYSSCNKPFNFTSSVLF